MPPRKRQKLTPSASTSDPAAGTSPPPPAASTLPHSFGGSTVADSSLPDSLTGTWTPAQECALFKQIIQRKPTGVHKHMHMLNIWQSLQTQGQTQDFSRSSKGPNKNAATLEHMRIPGIWAKLGSLYDLEALDAREDEWREGNMESQAHHSRRRKGTGQESTEENGGGFREFVLDAPGPDGYKDDQAIDLTEQMWARRLRDASEPSSSPTVAEFSAGSEASPAGRRRGGARGSISGRGRGQMRRGRSRGGRSGRSADNASLTPREGSDEDMEEDHKQSQTQNDEDDEQEEEQVEADESDEEEGHSTFRRARRGRAREAASTRTRSSRKK